MVWTREVLLSVLVPAATLAAVGLGLRWAVRRVHTAGSPVLLAIWGVAAAGAGALLASGMPLRPLLASGAILGLGGVVLTGRWLTARLDR